MFTDFSVRAIFAVPVAGALFLLAALFVVTSALFDSAGYVRALQNPFLWRMNECPHCSNPFVFQGSFDFSCGLGGADCASIRQGGPCYNTNVVHVHASYAMNIYYQIYINDCKIQSFFYNSEPIAILIT